MPLPSPSKCFQSDSKVALSSLHEAPLCGVEGRVFHASWLAAIVE
jgi:hypothetical protein